MRTRHVSREPSSPTEPSGASRLSSANSAALGARRTPVASLLRRLTAVLHETAETYRPVACDARYILGRDARLLSAFLFATADRVTPERRGLSWMQLRSARQRITSRSTN